jgi:hypothetical protein
MIFRKKLVSVGFIRGLYGIIESKQRGVASPLTYDVTPITLTKMNPEVYRGISFVRLSSLPIDQNRIISKTKIRKINIQTESSVLTDCVQYLDYEKWFDSMRTSQNLTSTSLLE